MARSNAAAAIEADDLDGGQEEPSLRDSIENARDEVIDRQIHDAGGEDAGGGPGRDASGRFTRRAEESEEGGKPKAQASDKGGEKGGAPASNRSTQGGGERAPSAAAAASTQPAASQQVAPAGQQQSAAAQTQGPDSRIAPQGWSAAMKAKWPSLPEDVRAEISRREADMHRAMTTRDDERAFGREFQQLTQQHQSIIQATGVTPQRLFSDFMGIVSTLRGPDPNAKARLLLDVARANGINLAAYVGGAQQQRPANPNPQPGANGQPPANFAPLPPALQTMQQEWEQMKSQLAQQRQREDSERQARQQVEEQQTLQDIMAFRSTPEARFFDEVRDHMIALLNGDVASNLEEAYSQAVWARPDLRAILQKEEADKSAQEQAKRQRAHAARQKGGSIRGGAGSSPGSTEGNRSLREELQAGFAEARSRV
jgi:hypothetical protein